MSKRPIRLMATPGVEPSEIASTPPTFEWVDPRDLLVDETYQRNLSERSVTLIRKIVGNWDWRRFKPPVVAMTADGMEVIDGQHTAIGAASHPGIETIPVMVVVAAEQAERAMAFIGQNRDRITITPAQLHYAAVAAGDEDALTIDQVCERAGVKILRVPPGNGAFKIGDTMAISGISALINRRGAMRARIILEVLAKASCAPVSIAGIKAVEMLLHDKEYAGQVPAEDVTSVLIKLGPQAEQEARVFAAAHSVPVWRGLGVVLFKEARRGRRRAA